MNQRGYVDDLLKRFGMVDSKPVATPMSQGTKLARNEKIDSTQVDVPYRELVGALMYLSVCTRPDITHAASYLSQFNNCYDSDHWTAAKRVLRYLKGTRDVGLIYGKTSDPLTGFVDADWANCEIDRKSYTGFVFILAGCPISWESRKQRTVALSSMEAEYMAISDATKEATHLVFYSSWVSTSWARPLYTVTTAVLSNWLRTRLSIIGPST